MSVKFNQFTFAIAILQKLSERPYTPKALGLALTDFFAEHGESSDDILRRISRAIRKLRESGFEIRSAPNRPYELITTNFPLILTSAQREALALAAHVLADMGFSAQASELLPLSGFDNDSLPKQPCFSFSPPVDYSEDQLSSKVATLLERFKQQRQYTIRYRNSSGQLNTWNLDRSELRLHNGVLYLLAYVPALPVENHDVQRNRLFRVDRIEHINPSSQTAWCRLYIPSLALIYRMSGPLGSYQPRRDTETVLSRDSASAPKWVEIETKETYLFWFRQRLLQYGQNVEVRSPDWFVAQIACELKAMAQRYET